MKNHLLPVLFFAASVSFAGVPSDINYQGRLTDANGDAVTGDVSMSLKMFDAATGGNELYSEDIGTVTLDDNGVYSFQFGAGGASVVDREETIAIADGASTSFSNTLGSVPLDETLVVADGTYSWNVVDDNPGEQATATAVLANGFVIGVTVTSGGEGYTEAPVVTIDGIGSGATATAVVENGAITAINVDATGSGYTTATVTIAEPPAPYVVDYDAGAVSVTYETAPTAGTEILATYEANDSSIVGALSAAEAHWLELSVDGTAQSPRERVLSVPFATQASSAHAAIGELRRELDKIQSDLFYGAVRLDYQTASIDLTLAYQEISVVGAPYEDHSRQWSSWFHLDPPIRARTLRANGTDRPGRVIKYEDGTQHMISFSSGFNTNPYPEKMITAMKFNKGYRSSASNFTVKLYRDDIVSESEISLEDLTYRPSKIYISDLITSGFAEGDNFQVVLRGSLSDQILDPTSVNDISIVIGDLIAIVFRIEPKEGLVGDSIPIIGGIRYRFN